MFRKTIITCAVLALASAAQAQVLTGWKTMVTSGVTIGEPQGAPARTPPPGVNDPSLTPSILNGTAPTGAEPNGFTALYLLNTGQGQDNTGFNWSHLEAEGGSFVGFQGQLWTRWTGMFTSLRTAADAAFGTNRWTIQKIWVGVDPTGIGVGCNAGLVSLAEVSALTIQGGVADWGDKSQANVENATIAPTLLTSNYHGYQMGPTQASACVGVPAQQDAINPDFFKILDRTGGPQTFPNVPGNQSIAFQMLTSGALSRVRPVQDDFILYWAPIDDFNGGQGYTTAVSYDGFTGVATFGFEPYLLFELVKQDALTGATPPVANDLTAEAPFTAAPGPTCSATITASDDDLGDTLSFTITNPGTLGGTISPAGPTVGTNLGGGNWSKGITYTIPANARGVDQFSYSVSDGTNTSFGILKFVVRGAAVKNSVAFGSNGGDVTDAMRVYTGASVPDGGTSGTLDKALGPQFAQSTEYDNAGGIRHNPAGTILALTFGPAPGGPGTLLAYRTLPTCDPVGGRVIFSFAPPNVVIGPARTVGLSVSPDNTKLAVFGTNQLILYILNYNAAVFPPVVTLNKEVDLSLIYATTPSVGTTWLDNNNVLVLDSDANLYKIQVFPTVVIPGTPLCPNPRGISLAISSADIEYNPEISPYVYVGVGEFGAGVSLNTLYVANPATGLTVPQSMGQSFTTYDDGLAETIREIGFDCFGNLFIGTFVDNAARVNLKYIPNAKDVGGIVGGDSSLVVWRTIPTPGEGTSNFSGMDVATGTTIGGGGTCANGSPAASFVNGRTSVNTACTVTLRAVDYNPGDTISFMVIGTFGPAGGALLPFGVITTSGIERTQMANYTPATGFRGVECFSYKATDNGTPPLQNNSNISSVCISVFDNASAGNVAFGADLFDQNETMKVYDGHHAPNGGTNGVEDVLTGRSFAGSTEYDNFNSIRHNPMGNLFALRTGSATGGGFLYVYPTKAACNGNPGTILYRWDGLTGGDLDRVSGLSVSPDNTKMAVYGFDSKKIYFLNYTAGAPGDVGFGGTLAATVAANSQVEFGVILTNSVPTVANRGTGTAWLSTTELLWVHPESGSLYSLDMSGTFGSGTLRTTCPKTITNLSSADVEYNPAISPNVYVTVGEFLSPTSTNTLYVVNPATWAIVAQSGGATFTDHTDAGVVGTFRENGLASGGKLFIGTFAEANRVNIRYINNATTPGGITNDSSIVWNTMDVGQTLTSFNGLDVANGTPACDLPGDMNFDGKRNGKDIQLFSLCVIQANLGVTPDNCICADVAAPFGTLNLADIQPAAFVNLILTGP